MPNPSNEPLIRVSHLSRHFGARRALDEVSCDIPAGEITGLLGPNGAGKTTLLRILAGYLAATSGRVTVAGLDVFEQSLAVRRRLGYLPENAPLYSEMRVDEFLVFRARLKGVARRKLRARLEEVKELCGLSELGRGIIGRLSRGCCQRVGLADCLVHDPELLVLDEPTMGLDPNQRRATRELLHNLGRRYTILLSTHLLAEAETVCSRLIILDRGRVAAADATAALLTRRPAGSVAAEIWGPVAAVQAGLTALPGVQGAACSDGAADGWNRWQLAIAGGADIREALFALVVSRGWRLRELRAARGGLEDVFTRLTGGAGEGES